MDELIDCLSQEQNEQKEKKLRLEAMASLSWHKEFGHCFPDLVTGIHRDVAKLRRNEFKNP